MKYGEAINILNQIPTGNMTPKEIKQAVRKILSYSTVTVKSDTLINAVRWLIDELEGLHK